MEAQSANDDEQNLRLIAERDAILKQLATLGDELSDSDDGDDVDLSEARSLPNSDGSNSPESQKYFASRKPEESKIETTRSSSSDGSGDEIDQTEPISEEFDRRERTLEEPDPSLAEQGDSAPQLQRTILDRVFNDKTSPLPEGWTVIPHKSGMPAYYHKHTKVVTHSKPYQFEGVVRDHNIPMASIPCLHRMKMEEQFPPIDEKKIKKEIPEDTGESSAPESLKMLKEKSTFEVQAGTITPEGYREYCSRRFKFKEITVTRADNSSSKLDFAQERKTNAMLRNAGFEMDYDELKKQNKEGDIMLVGANGVALIDLTPIDVNKRGGCKKPFLLNPMGKTSVAVLNEFIQRLVKGALKYDITDTRNVSCPYQATASLVMKVSQIAELAGQTRECLAILSEIASMAESAVDNAEKIPSDCKRFAIGHGMGANKKTARLVAAKEALGKLIPKMRFSEEYVCDGVHSTENQKGFEEEQRELFKKVKIDSQNLVHMCARFAIIKPHNLLKDAVSRSLRWNGMTLEIEKALVGPGSNLSRVTLTLGHMTEIAEAVGVKQATHLASQLLLKQMHPEVTTYGGFLEMYGRFEDKSKQDHARKQHDEVVRLQDTGNLLQPNFIVLSKLAEEMHAAVIEHPPRRYLYGLESTAAGADKTKKTTAAQYTVDDFIRPKAEPYPPGVVPLQQFDQPTNFSTRRSQFYSNQADGPSQIHPHPRPAPSHFVPSQDPPQNPRKRPIPPDHRPFASAHPPPPPQFRGHFPPQPPHRY